jgi:hypothetical protein
MEKQKAPLAFPLASPLASLGDAPHDTENVSVQATATLGDAPHDTENVSVQATATLGGAEIANSIRMQRTRASIRYEFVKEPERTDSYYRTIFLFYQGF